MDAILHLSQYMRVVNAVLLNRYDEDNLEELIIAIIFLLKSDESHKEILLRFVKAKDNRRISDSIENTSNIYDVLIKLIHIMNNNELTDRVARNNNQQRRNRNRNNSNAN